MLKRNGIKFPAASVLLDDVSSNPIDANTPRRANRFLAHQLLRMERAAAAGEAKLYWVIAKALIKRSKVYRMACLHKSLPFWYYKLSAHRVGRILETVERLIRTDSADLGLDRKYIPKADGVRLRPLGVPHLEWRIIMTAWTVALSTWLRPRMSP